MQDCFSNLPECLCIKQTEPPGGGYRICSLSHIPALTSFGPYQGELTRRSELDNKGDFMWQFEAGNKCFSLDNTSRTESNWLQYVNYAKHKEEQNLIVVQEGLEIYYITCKAIPANTELLVWYPVIISQERGGSEINFMVENIETDIVQDGEADEISVNGNGELISGRKNRHQNIRSLHIACTKFTENARIGNVLEQEENGLVLSDNRIADSEENVNGAEKVIRKTPKYREEIFTNNEKTKTPETDTQSRSKTSEDRMAETVQKHCLQQRALKDIAGMREEILQSYDFLKRIKLSLTHCIERNEKDQSATFCERESNHSSSSGRDINEHTLGILIGSEKYKCNACGKVLASSKTLKEHKMRHSGKLPYGCNVCGKKFLRMAHLKTHELTHTGERRYRCDVCGKAFVQSWVLKAHKIIHSGEKPYDCKVCGRKFRWKACLKIHEVIHGEWSNKSAMCKRQIYTVNHRKRMNCDLSPDSQNDKNPYMCNICGKSFTQKIGLISHERIHPGEKHYACNVCGKKFALRYRMAYHQKIHTTEKPFICDTCGMAFKKQIYMVKHKKRMNCGLFDDTTNAKKPYSCNICKKGYTQKIGLIAHESIHTGEKPYECKICGKKFPLRYRMVDHQKVHTSEKPFACTLCGKTFRWKSGKIAHEKRIHSCHNDHSGKVDDTQNSEKVYMCNVCNKQFTMKCNLQKHEKEVHTNEKPYECKICGKKFPWKYLLVQHHQKVHTTKECFACDACGMAFKSQICMVSHKKRMNCGLLDDTLNSEKPFSCNLCKKGYTTKWNLKIHEKLHAREKPYECKVCGEKFLWRYLMVQHRVVHSKRRQKTAVMIHHPLKRLCPKPSSPITTMGTAVPEEPSSSPVLLPQNAFLLMGSQSISNQVPVYSFPMLSFFFPMPGVH